MNKEIKISVRSRNKSCEPLKALTFPVKVIYRMGSTTPTNEITHRKRVIEINSPQSCALSMDKIAMKKRFTRSNIYTAPWFMMNPKDFKGERMAHYLNKWKVIIAKHKNSSKGKGIYLIKSMEDYNTFLTDIQNEHYKLESFVFEKYFEYVREYRLHVDKNGCFYTCRKMLKQDAQERWHRHECNSVWILEDNKLFNKPTNWDTIVTMCVSALKSLELDVAAFDVKVQSDKHKEPKFIILESNSAPALGEIGIEKYKTKITEIVNETI